MRDYKIIRCDCGPAENRHEAADYLAYERHGRVMCAACFAKWVATPKGRAYEAWFVRE